MKNRAETARDMVDLVWDSLKRDQNNNGRRQTAWGSKTKDGLAACFERLMRGESWA